MTLKLPADELFARIPWIKAGYKHAAFEWQYLAAMMFENPSPSGDSPTVAAPGYLSSNLVGFARGAACLPTLDGSGVGDTDLRSFLTTWQHSNPDVKVRGTFVRRCVDAALGSSVDGGFRGAVLYARIQEVYGVFNAGTPETEHVKWYTGYALRLFASSTAPDADLTATLLRMSTNGFSLTFVDVGASHVITGGVANLDLAAGLDFSLSAEDFGGNAHLTAKLHGYNVGGRRITVTLFDDSVLGGTVGGGGGWTNVDGLIRDASGVLLEDGAVGFGLYAARDDTVSGTAVEVTEGILQFSVTDVATNIVVYADDFTRVGANTSEVINYNLFHRAISIHGDEGAWLNSLWAYSSTAATDNATDEVDNYLRRSVAGSTTHDPIDYAMVQTSLVVPSSSNPLSRDFIAARPADVNYSQHRSVEFKPFDHKVTEPNWAPSQDKYGILVRGGVSAGYVATCFVAYLEPIFSESGGLLVQDSLVCHLAIKLKASATADPVYLGLWSKVLAGVDLADGAFHSIDYNCHVFEDAQDVSAPIIHTIEVDGVAVVFDTPGAFSAGMEVLADGRVFDNGAFGPGSSGSVEGFFVETTTNETDLSSNVLREPAQFKSWVQGTLTTLDSTVPINEQPTFAIVGDEGASTVTGDLGDVFDPVFPFSEESNGTDPIEIKTEIGLRITRARATRTRRRWTLKGSPLSTSEKDALEAFWAAHGVNVPFNWTPDGEAAVIAYFLSEPRYIMVSVEAWLPSVNIEELLS